MKEEQKNILVLTYFSFKDGLIQAYTLPYLKLINEVSPERVLFLLTKEKSSMALSEAETQSAKESLQKIQIEWLPKKYLPFGLTAIAQQLRLLLELFVLIKKNKIGTIHCWGTPPGVEGYLLSKLTGCRLIIDSFEPHAEAQVENGSWTKKSLGYKILWWFEKRMARHAETLIYTTRNMISYAKSNYKAHDKKEYVKPACVDLNLFSERDLKDESLQESLGLQGKITALYTGKFGGIYHDIEVFQFFKKAFDFWGVDFRALILTPTPLDEITGYCKRAGLPVNAVIARFVAHNEIPRYMGLADFGMTPVKSVPTKKYCTPIKDGEYWALGLPVVITRDISDDSEIIAKYDIGYVLQDFSDTSMGNALKKIDHMLSSSSRLEIYQQIRPIAEKYRNFDIAHHIYSSIYT